MDMYNEKDYLEEGPEDLSNNFKETFDDLEATIRSSINNFDDYSSPLNEILDSFKSFLEDKPKPPQEWMDMLGEKANKYDYHQVVLPTELTDPYKDELDNIEHIRSIWGDCSFMALDAQLILRNKILYTNGHCKTLYVPKPLISLESNPKSEIIDWDCCLSIYPDGSYYSYNMDKDDQEDLSINGVDFFKNYEEIIRNMIFYIPIDGHDYGDIK